MDPRHSMAEATRTHGALRLISAAVLATAVAFALPGSAGATSFTDLGSAAGFAVLGLTGSVDNASNTTIDGNVGVGLNASLTVQAPSTINGNVYKDSTATVSGPGMINGTVVTQSMSGIVNDALNSFNNNTALTATQSFSSGITSGTTITGNGGLNVINVTGNINLGTGENLTLSGTSSDIFVINVSGTLSLTGNAKLLVSGVLLENVIYNFTGSSGTINTGVGDVLNGIFLAPNYSMTLDGIWNGEIISGKTIQLLSGVTVNGPSPVPEPSTLLLLGTGLTSLGVWGRKRLVRAKTGRLRR